MSVRTETVFQLESDSGGFFCTVLTAFIQEDLFVNEESSFWQSDDQTQRDLKPASQLEEASLNQCQLIAQNWCSAYAQLTLVIRFLCNIVDTRALIGPCSHVTLR